MRYLGEGAPRSYVKSYYWLSLAIAQGSKKAEKAREYASSRGISQATAEKLQIGYAPDGWDALVTAMTRDKKSLEDAKRAGLLGKKNSGNGHALPGIFHRGRLQAGSG